jgi:hypothetical protein
MGAYPRKCDARRQWYPLFPRQQIGRMLFLTQQTVDDERWYTWGRLAVSFEWSML